MLRFPDVDPVALRLGPIAIHWYGIMYLVAFALWFALARRRLQHSPYRGMQGPSAWSSKDPEDMLFLGVLGTIVGGRLGYALFYQPAAYLAHPLQILEVWKGGMSFHGGLLGVIASQLWFARTRGKPFWQVMDFVAPCVPLGIAAVRLGNFINGELWGRPADPALPWAMAFPASGSDVPRHPSQLYEFLLEGLLLFILLWLYARRQRRQGEVSGAFLVGYGLFRFIAEYFREPDSFLGVLALDMTMGQWLSLPMIVLGGVIWISARSSGWEPPRTGSPTAPD